MPTVIILLAINCAFILLDILTGFLQALKNKILSSKVMREGLLHKCAEILLYVLSVALMYGCKYVDIGLDIPSPQIITVYLVVMESVSIVENLKKINPDLTDNPFEHKINK